MPDINGNNSVGWTLPNGVEAVNGQTTLQWAIVGRYLCLRRGAGDYCFLSVP